MGARLLPGGKRTLVVLFIPSVERDGKTKVDQDRWVNEAMNMLGDLYGGATAYPKARGVWRDDEREGFLVHDEPAVIHCYTTPKDAGSQVKLKRLASFCRTLGRETKQGEVGLVIERPLLRSSRFQGSQAMKQKPKLDTKRIAKALAAEHRGRVSARGGYFGAMQLVAEIQLRFQVPKGGGRATDPRWTERRLVPLAPETLTRLSQLTKKLEDEGIVIAPLQLAGLLLERAAGEVDEQAAEKLARDHATQAKSA